MAGMAEQPPGAGGAEAAAGVVHDHGGVVVDAAAAHGGLEDGCLGQGMTAPAGGRRCGQVDVEVDKLGTVEVAETVLVEPGRTSEVPAHVEQHGGTPRGQLGGEHLGRHEDGVHAASETIRVRRRFIMVAGPHICTPARHWIGVLMVRFFR